MSPGNLPEIIAADLLDTLSLYAVATICTTMVKIQTDRAEYVISRQLAAENYQQQLVLEMTYYVLSGTLNPTHSHSQQHQ